MQNQPHSNTRLMESLKEGDTSALREIIERWERPLVSFIFRYTQHLPTSLDLAQETFVRIYQSRERFDPHYRFTTWMFSIAVNLCRKHARWKVRHPEWNQTDSLSAPVRNEAGSTLLEIADPAASPQDTDERLPALRQAIASLSHDLRSAILLHHYEGLSYSEIADIMKCSVRGVETRLYRARKQIRKTLGLPQNPATSSFAASQTLPSIL